MKKIFYKILSLLIILVVLFFIFLQYKKRINVKSEKNYFTKSYNSKLVSRNKKLSYIKYSNNDNEVFEKKYKEWTISDDSEVSNYKKLKDEIYRYLKEKNIELKNVKILIDKNNKTILNINDDNIENLDLQKYQNIVLIQNIIEKNNLQSENIKLDAIDFKDGSNYYSKESIGATVNILDLLKVYKEFSDFVSINAINRYLLSNGETLNSGLNKDINSITNKLEKSIEIFKVYEKQRNRNKTVFKNDKEDEQFFQKTIYSENQKENYIENKEGFFEVGYVNSTSKYFYAVYIEKLEKEVVVDLGYIIDKTINKFESEKNS